jgi:ABC-2 type transport system permease protein
MKSWAEERKTGSLELILTMPLSEWDLVLGKFLALFALLAINLVFTIGIPLSLAPMGYFDTGVIICEYIGVLLLGASALSLGLLMSAISKNQAGSFLSCAAVMLFVMLVNQLVFLINLPQWLNNFITFISLSFHFESFSKGILNSNDLVFFLLSTFLFLFLNTIVILNRKWR